MLRTPSASRFIMIPPPSRATPVSSFSVIFFFFNDPATTEISPLSLHDALPIWLVLQQIAYSQVGDCADAHLGRMLRRSNAGPKENGGAAKHAGGQDNFACQENLAIDELHANGALPFDNDAVYFSVTADRKVGASADRGSEISHSGVDTHTIDDVERIRADAMLCRAVEIRYTRQTDSYRGFNEGPHRRGVLLCSPLADRKRAAAAVPGVIAGRRVLQ